MTDNQAILDRFYADVVAIADQYGEMIDGEHRFGSEGVADLSYTHAQWREIAAALQMTSRPTPNPTP